MLFGLSLKRHQDNYFHSHFDSSAVSALASSFQSSSDIELKCPSVKSLRDTNSRSNYRQVRQTSRLLNASSGIVSATTMLLVNGVDVFTVGITCRHSTTAAEVETIFFVLLVRIPSPTNSNQKRINLKS